MKKAWFICLLAAILMGSIAIHSLSLRTSTQNVAQAAVLTTEIGDPCWDPERGHCYPRIRTGGWGIAPAEWYAKFDIVLSSYHRYEAIKQLSPHTLTFASRDWNVWEIDEPQPEEWLARDSHGGAVPTGYGDLMDISNYCSESPTYGGQRYNQYLIGDTLARTYNDPIFDGFLSQGVWDHPYGTEDVDLDKNLVNDWVEYDRSWLEEKWLEGVHLVASEIMEDFKQTGKILLLNSGRFHDFEWENSNGLLLEHNRCVYSYKWFKGQYEDWMAAAPEPHVLTVDGMGESKDDFYWMRFLLGVTLTGDGYFSFSEDNSGEHHYLAFYDEYDLNLGWPTSSMQLVKSRSGAQDDQGVYARFYDNGAVIVNVDEEGQIVTDSELQDLSGYDGPYYRFQGGQDPAFNDGQRFDEVTLNGTSLGGCYVGDAILLTNEPTTMVTAIYVDDTHQNTSPASQPAQLIGDGWTRGECSIIEEAWTQNCRPWRDQWSLAYASQGNNQAVYTPTINVPGSYEVFEWHGDVTDSNEATNVPVTIQHAQGSDVRRVNQRQNQGQWNSLGIYSFEKGTSGTVTISTENTDGIVIADAFMFVFQGNHGNIKGEPASPSEDVNLDGHIDILDLQLAINALLGVEKDGDIRARADVNRDGIIDQDDLMHISEVLLQ